MTSCDTTLPEIETGASGQLREALAQVRLLREACHRWLTDPDCPGQYCLDPRADEIYVVVEIGESRRRVLLTELLAVHAAGRTESPPEIKTADPRVLLPRLAFEERRLLAALDGLMRAEAESALQHAFRQSLLNVIQSEFPAVARRIVDACRGVQQRSLQEDRGDS